jgi:HD-like signal output (HDOD) protein
MLSPAPDLKPVETSEIIAVANELGASGGGVGAARLMALLFDDSVDAAEVVRCLQAEPALAARVLKVANSAYYRQGGNVGTFEQALVVLGLSGVRGIAAVACMDRMPVPHVGNLLDAHRFRRHSIAVAAAAQLLSQRAGAGVDGEAFMAGLIHGIGLIILARLRPQAIASLADPGLDEAAVRRAELDLLGIDQASASAIVAEAWHLPTWLCTALRSYHTPQRGSGLNGTAALSALLVLGSRCAAAAGLSLWATRISTHDSGLAASIGIDDDVYGEIVSALPDTVLRITSV